MSIIGNEDRNSMNLWHLQQCPLFKNLRGDDLDAVFTAAKLTSFGPGEPVVNPKEVNEGKPIWLVKRGHVKLGFVDDQGRESTVMILSPGDLFGAFPHATVENYGEQSHTLTSACLCSFSQADFDKLLRKFPTVAYEVHKAAFRRIEKLQVRMADLLMKPIEERLAITLLQLNRQIGEDDGSGGRLFSLPLSHRDLANLVGSSREMVTHVLRRFRADGLIESGRKELRLKNLDLLEKLARGEQLN
ncbi:MAG: Crp/Fnr family transcriptional regulator [Sumerlaeia bacterium]